MREKKMLSVRPLQQNDIQMLADYWFTAEPEFLTGMGVDLEKMISRDSFTAMLEEQLNKPMEEKRSYAIIWLEHGRPIGHCNTNPTFFGDYAHMHLHLWGRQDRKKGLGASLVKMTLPHFFDSLQLRRLVCEPYALNPAPNRTLEKLGFVLEKEYVTTPGFINFEQPVKRWVLTAEQFRGMA
ncbi:MAG: GNAT family N-acetyltransferase [Phaeodactylibacter sp.]|nr:GNAT family N-acetyltransferase [Phaeodactylibacter sp.]